MNPTCWKTKNRGNLNHANVRAIRRLRCHGTSMHMNRLILGIASLFLTFSNNLASAGCTFQLQMQAPKQSVPYELSDVRNFVVREIRPILERTENRQEVSLQRQCGPHKTDLRIQIQTDGYQIVSLDGQDIGEDVRRSGEQNLVISRETFESLYDEALDFKTISKSRQADVLKILAYVLAESAKFSAIEERLDDLFKNGCRVNWSESKRLFRRWKVLSAFSLTKRINDHAVAGGKSGDLLAPISTRVIDAYNAEAQDGKLSRYDDFIDKRDFAKPLEWDSPSCVPDFMTVQEERDDIFALLAYGIVLQDWQDMNAPRRGHNIGSVLVNPKGFPVFWARNANNLLDDSTQHGEVRLIQDYLACKGIGAYVHDYTVYTTLEPCAMCAGLMTLSRVSRVVYGQNDPAYGNAAKALLAIDYPNVFENVSLDVSPIKRKLDSAFAARNQDGKASIIGFLLSSEAKEIFSEAADRLMNYSVKYEKNRSVLEAAQALLANVGKEDPVLGLSANCPKN